MKRTTIAYVDSSRDRCKRYIVIRRGNRFECSCLDFFFKEDRDDPCKHIRQVLKTSPDGTPQKLACVDLSRQGTQIVTEYHARKARERLAATEAEALRSNPADTKPRC